MESCPLPSGWWTKSSQVWFELPSVLEYFKLDPGYNILSRAVLSLTSGERYGVFSILDKQAVTLVCHKLLLSPSGLLGGQVG